jgi:hypothetical protein
MAKKSIAYMQNFSTNAKYIVHNWPNFSDMVIEFASATKQTEVDLLQDTATLEDAFNGGFSFCFRGVAQVLVQLEQVLAMVRVGNEDAEQLTPMLLADFGCSKVEVGRLVPAKLEKLRKKILNKLPGLSKQLTELHEIGCNAVLTDLREREVMINENERQELSFRDSRRGLHKRLDDLALKNMQADEVLSWESYFRYKMSVVVKNAFSRLQQHRSDNDVEQLLRKMKPCFDIIRREKDKFVAENIQPLQQLVDEAIRVDNP